MLKAFLAIAALGMAVPAAAATSVFDLDRARAFCAAGAAEAADGCLSEQEVAARRIDQWILRGDLPRYLSRRAFVNCDARYRPDYRLTWACIEDRRDDRRDGAGIRLNQGVRFGR